MPSIHYSANPRKPVPVSELRNIFLLVMDRLKTGPDERAAAWAAARDDNARAYSCYRAILNSWS